MLDYFVDQEKQRIRMVGQFTAWLFFAMFSIGTVWADQIVLKDDDRITGNIVKKDGDTVTIESKNFGTV
ncbi:MAG: hypothetical protein AB7O65_05860, partial [Candidatus Korobacteraceae bacterium]